MSPQLPQEIIDRIAFYLPYELAIGISEYMKSRLGDLKWQSIAEKGNLFGIKWMHYHEYEMDTWPYSVMDWAASNGQLEVVKWLHKNRSEGCTPEALFWAASKGHLEIVKYLYENKLVTDIEEALDAGRDKPAVLDYLQSIVQSDQSISPSV